VGPKEESVLVRGRLSFGRVAYREPPAGPRRPDRLPLLARRAPGTPPASEPAPGHLLNHRLGPGAEGDLQPASAAGRLVLGERRRSHLEESHAHADAYPEAVASGSGSLPAPRPNGITPAFESHRGRRRKSPGLDVGPDDAAN